MLALLVDYGGEFVVLVLDLLDDFLLDTLLLKHSVLHRGALIQCLVSLAEQLLELVDLERAGLLECHAATAATMQVEVAIVAEGLVVDATVSGQDGLIIARTDANLSFRCLRLSWSLILWSRGLCHAIVHRSGTRICFHHVLISGLPNFAKFDAVR